MPNISDKQQVDAAEKANRRKRHYELEDLRSVLQSPAGRRFVWRYLTIGGVFQSSFTGDNATFFNEGRRDIGLKLMADVMEADPDAYVRMAKEHQAPKQNPKQEETNARSDEDSNHHG